MTILTTLGRLLMSILASLMTEALLKRAIYEGLKMAAKKSATDADDAIVRDVGRSWGFVKDGN